MNESENFVKPEYLKEKYLIKGITIFLPFNNFRKNLLNEVINF